MQPGGIVLDAMVAHELGLRMPGQIREDIILKDSVRSAYDSDPRPSGMSALRLLRTAEELPQGKHARIMPALTLHLGNPGHSSHADSPWNGVACTLWLRVRSSMPSQRT